LVVFTLSAVRIFVTRPGVWIPILLVCGGGLFLIGYLTPTPDDEEDDDMLAEADEEEAAGGEPRQAGRRG
jgi:hypothetical protein